MSGVRRKTKYRKGVETDVLDSLPEVKEGEQIVRMVASRGGNLIEVETPEAARSLCRLPNRYRKVVWVKRGTLLIVGTCTDDFLTATGEEGKVKFVVNNVIFTDDQVKHLRKIGQLPAAFDTKDSQKTDVEMEDNDPLLRVNRNRRPDLALDESSSEDDEDEDEEDEGGEEDDEKHEHLNDDGEDDDDDSE